jgi:hypothetical protein
MANYFYDLPEELIRRIYTFIMDELIDELKKVNLVYKNIDTIRKISDRKLCGGLSKWQEFKKAVKFCPLFDKTENALKDNKVLMIWDKYKIVNGRLIFGYPREWFAEYNRISVNVYGAPNREKYNKFPISPHMSRKIDMVCYLLMNNQVIKYNWSKCELAKACMAF